MIDFHTHVLHSIDDGPAEISESLNLISELESQGVKKIICTPHINLSKTDIESFVHKRDFLLKELISSVPEDSEISLISGAEVYFDESLLFVSDFRKLCIENTNLILIEFPFGIKWSKSMKKILDYLVFNKSLRIIVAHAERYNNLHKHAYRYIRELIEMDCLIQINCDFVNEKLKSSAAFDMLKNDLVHIIATDTHGIEHRPPKLSKAKELIDLNLGQEVYIKLENNARELMESKGANRGTVPLFF